MVHIKRLLKAKAVKRLGGIVSFVVVAGTTEVVVVMNFFESNDAAKPWPSRQDLFDVLQRTWKLGSNSEFVCRNWSMCLENDSTDERRPRKCRADDLQVK